MVAGAQKTALIEDFHNAVNAAIENGTGLEQFRQEFDQIVAKHGWDYHGSRNWRSEIIYRTNMRAAYSAGHWASFQRVKKSRPYIRYDAVQDNRTRPAHKAWHNTVLPVDHLFWETHFPPNGWNCRCMGRSMNERDLKRAGLKVSEDPEINLEDRVMIGEDGSEINIRVPEGIHTGFAYNPGIAGFGRGVQERALNYYDPSDTYSPINVPGALNPAKLEDLEVLQGHYELGEAAHSVEEAVDLLRQVIGGEEAVFADPTETRIRVTLELARHVYGDGTSRSRQSRTRYFNLIPEMIADPQEIWVGFAQNDLTGKVSMRRRYIRYVQLENNTLLGLVAETYAGEWIALTSFHGKMNYLKRLREGLQVF